MKQQLTLSIVGSGGDGAVAAGDILSMACARDGLNIIKTEAYGPQIRGGESSCTVRMSSSPIYAQADELDALAVFSWADFARFRSELVLGPDAVVEIRLPGGGGYGPAAERDLALVARDRLERYAD